MGNHSYNSLKFSYTDIILDNIADGVFTVDEKMKITYFNKAAEKITGFAKEEAIGEYCFDILKANICEKNCPLRCSVASETEVIDRHVNILRTDGKQIPVSISTAVLRDENGNKIGGVETFRDLTPVEELKKEINCSYTFEDIISKNHQILRIFDVLPNISESDSAVLIEGPSGSGKELFARAIHNLSHRSEGPFVAVNCGALPDNLLESELFGYVQGAFTDAKKDKSGRFQLAQKGTIFLDEVDSLTPATQVKLLRVLQEKEFEPLGATESVKTDVRIIAATKEKLSDLVNKGSFRDDLYFRLNVVKITLPPLKQRREDIPLLIEHFVEKFNNKMGKTISGVSDEVIEVLMRYDFPGNVRELENIIEHSFVMCKGAEIQLQHLPPELTNQNLSNQYFTASAKSLKNLEKEELLNALNRNNWNKVDTAKELGIHRSTLYRKIQRYFNDR